MNAAVHARMASHARTWPRSMHGIEGKEPMFVPVPFAGARRQVGDRDLQPVSLARRWSSRFHSFTCGPLLPPRSAVIVSRVAFG
jgi:hypothetical protein